MADGPAAKRPPQSWLAPGVPDADLEDGSEEEADMRTLAFVLLAAVIGAAAVFYGMTMTGGEGNAERTVKIVPVPEEPASHGSAADWLANLERHDPPLEATDAGFTDADGNPLTLADFRGTGVVVNLWATWCGPCVREMPSLNRLQKQVEADGIKVVAVSSDRGGRDIVEAFMTEYQLDGLTPYLDPKAAFTTSLEGRGLPRTYILNAAGEVTASYIGPAEWDEPEMVAAVRELAR